MKKPLHNLEVRSIITVKTQDLVRQCYLQDAAWYLERSLQLYTAEEQHSSSFCRTDMRSLTSNTIILVIDSYVSH